MIGSLHFLFLFCLSVCLSQKEHTGIYNAAATILLLLLLLLQLSKSLLLLFPIDACYVKPPGHVLWSCHSSQLFDVLDKAWKKTPAKPATTATRGGCGYCVLKRQPVEYEAASAAAAAVTTTTYAVRLASL